MIETDRQTEKKILCNVITVQYAVDRTNIGIIVNSTQDGEVWCVTAIRQYTGDEMPTRTIEIFCGAKH